MRNWCTTSHMSGFPLRLHDFEGLPPHGFAKVGRLHLWIQSATLAAVAPRAGGVDYLNYARAFATFLTASWYT
jgi:hypothetical protein